MTGNGSFRALIVEHERATPGGLVYDWLDDYDVEVEELRIDVEERAAGGRPAAGPWPALSRRRAEQPLFYR